MLWFFMYGLATVRYGIGVVNDFEQPIVFVVGVLVGGIEFAY